MSVPSRLLALMFVVLAVAACSAGGSTPSRTDDREDPTSSPEARVGPEEVAERLLTQLRDEDYEAAYETLSTGRARDLVANGLDLMTKLMSANTLVEDWSLEEPKFDMVDEQRKVEIGGTVTYDDGETGRVLIVMQALGLKADPWRIDEFELTRE